MALLVFTVGARAQAVSTYIFTPSSGAYTFVTGGTQLIGTGSDNEVFTVPIAGGFPFAGAVHASMFVSVNGFISFGLTPGGTNFTPLSSSTGYAAAISAFGTDLEDGNNTGTNTNVRWQQIGNEMVVQWRDMERNSILSNNEFINFQIRLNQVTGVINIVYGPSSNTNSSLSDQPQVGLRGPNNSYPTNINNRLVNTTGGSNTWATSINGTANTSTCRYNNATFPVNGQTYTWTPPCTPPTTSNAGPDQTICTTTPSVVLAANGPSVGTGAWSVVSGPSTSSAQFSSTGANDATFTPATGAGTYRLRWTISNSPCTASTDDVDIVVNAPPSTANAGPSQTICASPGTATMNATAPTSGTGLWTQVSGGSASITTPSSRTTTITGMTTPGARTFRWTVSNNPCSPSTSDVVITVDPQTYAVWNGLSYTEGFESWISQCGGTSSIPSAAWSNNPVTGNNSWRRNDQGATASWDNGATGAYSPASTQGSYSARFHSAGIGTGGILDLHIDMSASPGLAELGFDYINTGGTDNLTVRVSTNGGGSFTALGSAIVTQSPWGRRTFTITSTSATTVIRFQTVNSTSTSDIGIDNLEIIRPCVAPSANAGIPVTNCIANTFSFPVTVTSIGNAASVDIVATPGGSLYSAVGPGTYTVGPYSFGTSVTVTVNGNPGCTTTLPAVTHSDPDGVCHGSSLYTIADNGCASSNFRYVPFCVSSTGTQLGTDVFVRSVDLIASHTYGRDLRFSLFAPNGNRVDIVNAGHGGNGTQYGNASACPGGLFTFENGAASMSGMAASSTNVGIWAPDVSLNDFHDGSNPTGTWTLRACDAEAVDLGAVRYVRVNLCTPVQATLSRVNDCPNNQFRVSVNVSGFGSGTSATVSYTVNGGAPVQQSGLGIGSTLLGPFPSSAEVDVTVTNGLSNCGNVRGTIYSTCPVTIDCGSVLSVDHCYRNNDTRTFTYLSPIPGETVTLNFIQGSIDLNDAVNIYNGTNNTAPSVGGGNFFGNLAGQTFTSTGPAIHVEISSNGSNSCFDGGQGTPWNFEVKCTPGCTSPNAFIDVNNDCASYTFNLDVTVFDTGDGATCDVVYTVNGGSPLTIPGVMPFDPVNLGPFTIGDQVNIILKHESDFLCNNNLGNYTNSVVCPSAENCINALNLGNQNSPLSGTTIGRVNDYSFACGTATANTAADAIYYIDVPAAQQLNIRQQSNTYDSQHYVRFGGACPGTTVIACVDDDGGEVGWVNWVNSTGSTQRVWWIQDGYAANTGNFVLEWNIVTCPTPTATAATNVLSNSASANYSGFAGNYIIEYGPSATFTTPGAGATPGANGTLVTATSSPVQLTGLNPSTGYRYFVRRNCGGGSYSSNSSAITFTTGSGVAVANGVCGLNHSVPDNGCGSSNSLNALITMSGLNPSLGTNVILQSVDLIITHTSRSHLQVRLTSPTGQTRNMILQRGGSGDNFGNSGACPGSVLTLMDGGAALSGMSTSTTNITGTFAPEQSLGAYTGNPNGTWTLSICDNVLFTSGALRYVKLNFAPLDCQGVPNGPALPGTPCNDADACTINDTWTPGCACVGTFQDTDGDGTCNANDGCPNDPNKIAPGACGCGVADVPTTYYADSDGDGAGDPNSPLAGFTCLVPPGHVGNANDGCPADPNKIAPGICGCGTPDTDSDGDTTADCIDGCPADPLKIAPGQCGCGIPDTDTDGDSTADCNDGCPNDPNKVAPGTCGCGTPDVDSDGDGLFDCEDNCPNLSGVIGSPCNDGNAGTILDQINASCICEGTVCTELVNFEIDLDQNGSQISWQIAQEGTGIVVCSGGISPAYPNNVPFPVVESCCLPIGCYTLEVYDSAGDGILGGGYQLRETGANGRRIIDNTGNFHTGSISSIPGGQDFCVPMGQDKLIFSSCDKMDWVNYKYLVAHANAAVSAEWVPGGSNAQQPTNSGYEFWIFDPNGTYSFRKFRSHRVSDGFSPAGPYRACHMKLNGWYNQAGAPHVPADMELNIRVRGRVNGTNQAFGPACKMKIDAIRAQCPLVKLQDDPSNVSDYSCGVIRTWGGTNTAANRVVAKPPQFSPAPTGPVRYQFRFRIPGEGFCTVRPPQASPTLYLNWSTGAPLECGKQYAVEVRVSKDGGASWCVDGTNPVCDPGTVVGWGKVCMVTIANCFQGGGAQQMRVPVPGGMDMPVIFPNPNNGDRLTINWNMIDHGRAEQVHVELYDLTGQRVHLHTFAGLEGTLNGTMDLGPDLASGIYLIHLSAGELRYTERLIIQR